MKHNMVTKRLFALALVLVMALSLAVPAMAADIPKAPYQITIKPNQYVSTPDDPGVKDNNDLKNSLSTRFWAYQIFTGTLGEDYQSGDKKVNQLSDVKWGASIADKEALVTALKGDTTPAADMGVTYERMFAAGNTYLTSPALSNYAGAYNAEDNWKENTVGGELTEEGETSLKAAFDADIGGLMLGHLFIAGLGKVSANEAAAHVAKVISDFTPATGNVALAKWFAAVVGDRTTYDTAEGTYKYLKTTGGRANQNGDNKYEGAYAVSTWRSGSNNQPLNGTWTIGESRGPATADPENLTAGYYLIRDVYQENYWYGGNAEELEDSAENLGRSNFEYIVAVFGDNTVSAKAAAPTVSKTIENKGRADDLESGETVTFLLTGRLAENYETAYEGYPYIFTDTMDAGLTDGEIVRVYVRVPNATGGVFGTEGYQYDIYVLDEGTLSGLYPNPGAQNLKRYILEQSDNTTTVTFPTLKALSGKKVVTAPWTTDDNEGQVPVTSDSIVYVEYTATLSEAATVAALTGNRNKVVLNYANDPNWDPAVKADGVNNPTNKTGNWLDNWDQAPTGKTTAAIASVFDFGIQIEKQDERNEPLKDAAFALKKIEHTDEPEPDGTDTTCYAILHQVRTADAVGDPDPAPAQYTYYLAGWVEKADLDTYLAGDDTSKSWSDKLTAKAQIGDFTVPQTGDYYVSVLTQSDGRVRIEGLGSETTYYLEEVITPDGYDTMEDVSVQFEAAYNGNRIQSLTATVNDETVYDLVENGAWTETNPAKELVAKFSVINTPSGFLPGTGGAGVYLFYVGGSALLLGAVLLLIFTYGKKKPEQQAE